MPVFLIPLLFAAILFMLPMVTHPAPIPALPTVPTIEILYTRGGIVHFNRSTGATRFTPYKRAGHMDRRARLRA